MKVKIIRTEGMLKAIAAVSVVLLSGCTAELEQRVKKLESAVNDMRSFQAEQTTQISYLQGELRKLTGKTEEIEFTTEKKYGPDLNTLKEDLSTLKKRVPPPANVPVFPLEEDEALSERSGLSEFSDALLRIREGNYQAAIPKLQDLLQSGPPDASPNVLFWIGVCYDGESDYKQALSAYHDLTTQFPKSKRSPLALLREASVFDKIGDGKAASITLQKLVETYPDSPEAMQVKSRFSSPKPGTKAAPPPAKKKKK